MSDTNINATNSNNSSAKPTRNRRLTAGESKELIPILYNKFMHGKTKQQLAKEYNIPYNTLIGMFNRYILSLPEDEQERYDYRNKRGRYYAMFMDDEEMDDYAVETKDTDLEEETIEEPHKMPFMNESKSEAKEEVKEETTDTSDLDGKVFRLFEANDAIEVDLYKGQKNSFSDRYIFENKVEAINNLTISKQDVRDFMKKNVKFTYNGNPKSDIILYISSTEDYGLGYPVVDVCNEMGILLSICVFDQNSRRFNHYYATAGGNSNGDSDKGMYYNMFPDVNRVEGLGCDIEHILDAEYLYQMKETVYKNDGSRFVYKLLCMELEPLKEYYASLIGHVVLDREDHISLSLQKCRINVNGKLVEVGEEIMPFKNFN